MKVNFLKPLCVLCCLLPLSSCDQGEKNLSDEQTTNNTTVVNNDLINLFDWTNYDYKRGASSNNNEGYIRIAKYIARDNKLITFALGGDHFDKYDADAPFNTSRSYEVSQITNHSTTPEQSYYYSCATVPIKDSPALESDPYNTHDYFFSNNEKNDSLEKQYDYYNFTITAKFKFLPAEEDLWKLFDPATVKYEVGNLDPIKVCNNDGKVIAYRNNPFINMYLKNGTLVGTAQFLTEFYPTVLTKEYCVNFVKSNLVVIGNR